MNSVEGRIVRRETHSPRSAPAIVVGVLLIAAIAWIGTEGVLSLLGMRPLALAPRALAAGIAAAPRSGVATLVPVAVVAGVAGLVLLAAAILPGRRGRRPLAAERLAAVADDEVLASALARRAARAAGVSPDAVTVSLGRRSGAVRIVPVSGRPVERDEVLRAVQDEFALAGSTQPARIAVHVSPHGKVGS